MNLKITRILRATLCYVFFKVKPKFRNKGTISWIKRALPDWSLHFRLAEKVGIYVIQINWSHICIQTRSWPKALFVIATSGFQCPIDGFNDIIYQKKFEPELHTIHQKIQKNSFRSGSKFNAAYSVLWNIWFLSFYKGCTGCLIDQAFMLKIWAKLKKW